MLRSTRKRRMGTSAASALQQPTLAYPHAKRRRDNSSESSGDGDVNQSSDAGNSPTFSTTSPTSNVRRSRRSQSESSDSSSSAVQAGGVPIQPVVPQVPAPQPPPVANPTPVVVPAAAPPQPHIPQPPVQPMVVAAANVGVPLLPQPPVPQPPVQPMIVAAANVGVPLLPPLPPLPPQQNAIARRRDDLLWYLMARKHIHGLSKKDFDYIFLDSDSLKGGLQQVTKEDVLSLEAETLRPYHRSVFYRCMCGTDVNTEAGDCGNRLCDGHLKKRGTVSERVRFSSFDISEQLAEIVSAEFGSILAHRERLHGNRTADNDEYRNSRDFKNRVESAADFANKKLKLVLLLNSDGFSPDGNYEKILNVRIFDGETKRWDKSVKDLDLQILSVSQFTLYGFLKGNKLDFHNSMGPDDAAQFYANFLEKLKKDYKAEKIEDGRFAAMMSVDIVNDGPVTITLDSRQK